MEMGAFGILEVRVNEVAGINSSAGGALVPFSGVCDVRVNVGHRFNGVHGPLVHVPMFLVLITSHCGVGIGLMYGSGLV